MRPIFLLETPWAYFSSWLRFCWALRTPARVWSLTETGISTDSCSDTGLPQGEMSRERGGGRGRDAGDETRPAVSSPWCRARFLAGAGSVGDSRGVRFGLRVSPPSDGVEQRRDALGALLVGVDDFDLERILAARAGRRELGGRVQAEQARPPLHRLERLAHRQR